MPTINELLAKWDTPEERALAEQQQAKYVAQPCHYDSVRECYVHGYFPKRPCGHVCWGIPCRTCQRPRTGRQRTRARWRRQGRRG